MKRALTISVMLLLTQAAFADDALDPRKEIEQRPGDIDGAVGRLGKMSEKYAARSILSLARMGKVSVHSAVVRRAFTYEFLSALGDATRLHEALELYERFAVANTDDLFWRLIRARCARLMDLPETPQLYEQVAADMTGVPGDDEVRQARQATREEFAVDDVTKAAWATQSTRYLMFVADAMGIDMPPSSLIKGSPFPYLDISRIWSAQVGLRAKEWTEALEGSALTNAEAIDGLAAKCQEHRELPWRNGRGFLNTERALTLDLLSRPRWPGRLTA